MGAGGTRFPFRSLLKLLLEALPRGQRGHLLARVGENLQWSGALGCGTAEGTGYLAGKDLRDCHPRCVPAEGRRVHLAHPGHPGDGAAHPGDVPRRREDVQHLPQPPHPGTSAASCGMPAAGPVGILQNSVGPGLWHCCHLLPVSRRMNAPPVPLLALCSSPGALG